jgi:hypothetical protein
MADNIYNILVVVISGGTLAMRIFALRKRQDHDISLPGAAALVGALLIATSTALPSHMAAAQGAVPCTAIDNDAERLACYDRALRGTPAPPAPATTVTETAPRSERRVREAAAPAAPAAPVARTAPTAPTAGAANAEPAIVPIVIVGVRALPGRETTFTTDDGVSWVQTDGQRLVGLPEAPFNAELKPGAMGSYFLVPADRGRAIRVRQVR